MKIVWNFRKDTNRLRNNLHIEEIDRQMQEERNRTYEDYSISFPSKQTSRIYQQKDKKIFMKVYIISSEQLDKTTDKVEV